MSAILQAEARRWSTEAAPDKGTTLRTLTQFFRLVAPIKHFEAERRLVTLLAHGTLDATTAPAFVQLACEELAQLPSALELSQRELSGRSAAAAHVGRDGPRHRPAALGLSGHRSTRESHGDAREPVAPERPRDAPPSHARRA
ncbi:MAG: hypothetical protein Q8Q09_19845 [Deltaproteobacteria bacterium]|nr:hypothetical protein [Deltaproteobacteria bacterium]